MNNQNPKIVFIALSLLICSEACKQQKTEKQEIHRPIRYMIVGSNKNKLERTFSGWARVGKDVTLSFRTSGIITEKNVGKGQFVKKGTLLGRLDNVEAQLAFEKAISELERARSEMNTSETNFNRVKYLYEQGAKPLIEYENARNVFASASSQYETALRNKDIQKAQLEYGIIYAPMNGVVLKTDGDVNERVNAGHEFVLLSISNGQMKVIVNLPEIVINRTFLKMPVEINFSVIPDKTFKGEVIEISPDISDESATYPVDIAILNPTDEIKPGMAASVSFDFTNENATTGDQIILPVTTVGEDANGNFVFVVISDDEKTGTVQKKTVKINTMTPEGFLISDGLSDGDKIVTAGLQSLLDGQKVSLK